MAVKITDALVDVANGGTGASTLTAHGVVIGNGTSAVAITGAGTAGQVLTSNGASADPTFQRWSAGAVKTADETVTSSNTLQDDDHLSFPIGANETWIFTLSLSVSANASGGMKWAFTVPSGAAATGKVQGTANPFSATTNTDLTVGNGTTNLISAATSNLIYGLVVNSSNAGTVQFRWSQNASFGTGTTLSKNSQLSAVRVS